MKPALRDYGYGEEWVDLDSPVSDDPDDGYIGMSGTEITDYIGELRAEAANLREQATAANEAASIAHGQRDDAWADLEHLRVKYERLKVERASCCAELEAEVARLRDLLDECIECGPCTGDLLEYQRLRDAAPLCVPVQRARA